ncbi:MAG TPA: hypothetical protein VGU68_20600 [Ktedonobacteraceae bacterium]|nr:hypothetical protein [Ktedonobacteraceae bacterium]
MQVTFDMGGEIQSEGIACNEQMRSRATTSAFTQQMTQMEQANAQSSPTMARIPFGPEQLGEVLTQMDAAFHRQIDEERTFLTRREQQHLIGMAHFWWT